MSLRKWLAMITLCLISLTTAAQGFVMVDAGYGSQRSTLTRQGQTAYFGSEDDITLNGRDFFVGLSGGFSAWDGKVTLALALAYNNSRYSYPYGGNGDNYGDGGVVREVTQSRKSYGVCPSVSYQVWQRERIFLYIMLEGRWSWGQGTRDVEESMENSTGNLSAQYDTKSRDFSVSVMPYIDYMLTDQWYVELTFNLLSIGYNVHTDTDFIPDTKEENNVVKTSGFDVGVNSVSTTLLNLGIGYIF